MSGDRMIAKPAVVLNAIFFPVRRTNMVFRVLLQCRAPIAR